MDCKGTTFFLNTQELSDFFAEKVLFLVYLG